MGKMVTSGTGNIPPTKVTETAETLESVLSRGKLEMNIWKLRALLSSIKMVTFLD